MILALGWSYLHVNGLRRPSLPTHHLETEMALGTSCEKQHVGILALSLSTKSSKSRIYPPNEKDDGIEDVQSARPKYRAQSRESAGRMTFRVFMRAVCKQTRICWMILEKMRKQADTVSQKKWTWKDEFLESLIGYIKEHKTVYDFNAPNTKVLKRSYM